MNIKLFIFYFNISSVCIKIHIRLLQMDNILVLRVYCLTIHHMEAQELYKRDCVPHAAQIYLYFLFFHKKRICTYAKTP